MPVRSEAARTNRFIFLHGFTQTHHHWHHAALLIAAGSQTTPTIVLPDLPGHGLSHADRTDMDRAGRLLPELCGRGTYIGYSMGGRFALAAAITRPRLVERLVLIGATAGIVNPAEREQRRQLDTDRADRVHELGVDAFVDEWLAAPMFGGLPTDPDSLEHRRRNTAAGLAGSLTTSGTGSQTPLWGRLDQIEAPTLVLAGERDTKFTAIGRQLADGIRDASFATIPGAGHAAHTERPDATIDAIVDWLTGNR